jgi:UDP:flavonoid glycosyltransferase YjiC (YdhE family)
MAEKLGCPVILASPLPGFTPTAAFPSPLLPFRSLGPFNRTSHFLATKGAHLLFGKLLKHWRTSVLGLSRQSTGQTHSAGTIYAYSKHAVPVPPDWGSDVLVSGYWFLDSGDWTPPASLSAFLEAGEPPIFIGFGSMPGIDPQHMASVMTDALTQCGKRGLLATGGGALQAANLPEHVHALSQAPHDRVFPFVSAVIHHGGAGTTGAALRAGKPMTICPFFGDQPFWARRMAEIGVAPRSLDRRKLSVAAVAASINAMANATMRERANALGQRIRQEDGTTAAVRFIEARCGPQ